LVSDLSSPICLLDILPISAERAEQMEMERQERLRGVTA
jgi:hypothetical protein